MKAAIVTFIRAYNHGAILQAYALHKKLNDLGIDNDMLDYYPKYFGDKYNLRYLGDARYFPYRPIKNWLKFIPMLNILKKRTKKFEKFILNNIRLSEQQYCTTAEVDSAILPYDAFICGSDQVWNHIHTKFDPVYFLDFTSANHARKWSYAASFGMKSVPEELREEYSKRLSNWDKYSVREKSGVDLLQRLTQEQAVQCCDPTLLLKREEWDEIRSKKQRKKPYILVYYVNSGPIVLEAAKELSKEKNLEIISITSIASYAGMVGTNSKLVGAKHNGSCAPDEFISLFANASYVITDSFHGTVFSLIYHKKFLSLVDMGEGKRNTRIVELLDVVGESKRELTANLSSIDNELDWEEVDKRLAEHRTESEIYLNTFRD